MTIGRVRGRHWLRRVGVLLLAVALLGTATGGVVVLAGTSAEELWNEWNGSNYDGEDELVGRSYYASVSAVCDLLAAEDLELALGYEYSEGFEPDITFRPLTYLPGATRCVYAAEMEAVTLGVVYAYADQIFAEARQRWAEDEDTSVVGVPDLGMDAIYVSGRAEHILVLYDDKIVALTIPVLVQEDERLERVRRLVEKALERLR